MIQCVLTQRFTKNSKIEDQALLEYLSKKYPSEYIYQISLKEFSITGSSPEMFLKVKNNTATIRPVAGTIANIKGKTQDLIRELKSSIKDKAEHIMLVDLARNDLGKIADPGSVKVNKLMDTMVYNNVIHLVSEVNGKIRKGKDFLDAFYQDPINVIFRPQVSVYSCWVPYKLNNRSYSLSYTRIIVANLFFL